MLKKWVLKLKNLKPLPNVCVKPSPSNVENMPKDEKKPNNTLAPYFEESPYLQSIWNEINEKAFDSSLPLIAAIGWASIDSFDPKRITGDGITRITKSL